MNDALLKDKLLELSNIIDFSFDTPEDEPCSAGVYVSQGVAGIDEVADQLRLQIKYLMFDLEASHRENRYLRQMLEMRPPEPRSGSDSEDTDPNNGWA